MHEPESTKAGESRSGLANGASGGQRETVTADLEQVVAILRRAPLNGLSGAAMIEELSVLETLKNVAAARQACLAVTFEAAERQAQEAAGVPTRRRGRGIAEQIALARRESPTRAASFLTQSRILFLDMPDTMSRYLSGELSEYRAGLVAREVALLGPAGRAQVDADLNPAPTDSAPVDHVDLAGLSNRAVRAAAATAAQRVDPTIIQRRGRHAESERYVSLRPAPDTMTILSAYLPVRQGVACLAALRQVADAARAAGDPRGQGQVMADTLIGRITGVEHPGAIPMELQIVMSDQALHPDADRESAPSAGPASGGAKTTRAADEPTSGPADHATAQGCEPPRRNAGPAGDAARRSAVVAGYGPVPSATVRAWLREGIDAQGKVWIRRFLTDPVSGQVGAVDRRARYFPLPLRRLILARDQYCRTPFCGAPIRHLDHVVGHAAGGDSEEANGQGLCERCNQAKAAPGWSAQNVPDPLGLGRHTVETTTPTGHTYRSTAPPALPVMPLAAGDTDRPSRSEEDRKPHRGNDREQTTSPRAG